MAIDSLSISHGHQQKSQARLRVAGNDVGRSLGSSVNIPSPKGEGFRETAQAGYGSAKGRLQSHTILKLSSGSSGV